MQVIFTFQNTYDRSCKILHWVVSAQNFPAYCAALLPARPNPVQKLMQRSVHLVSKCENRNIYIFVQSRCLLLA